mmetsp:Transcript_8937/g.30784  ORF Transcript_8937/g.30784 Transcript_8937/m.30784 type:complete len:300 (-) Transcript_8937:206-1105(-)
MGAEAWPTWSRSDAPAPAALPAILRLILPTMGIAEVPQSRAAESRPPPWPSWDAGLALTRTQQSAGSSPATITRSIAADKGTPSSCWARDRFSQPRQTASAAPATAGERSNLARSSSPRRPPLPLRRPLPLPLPPSPLFLTSWCTLSRSSSDSTTTASSKHTHSPCEVTPRVSLLSPDSAEFARIDRTADPCAENSFATLFPPSSKKRRVPSSKPTTRYHPESAPLSPGPKSSCSQSNAVTSLGAYCSCVSSSSIMAEADVVAASGVSRRRRRVAHRSLLPFARANPKRFPAASSPSYS